MNFGDPDAMVATRDPSDRAHDARDPRDPTMLLPGGAVAAGVAGGGRGRARKYSPAYMAGSGISHESVLDDTHSRLMRLKLEGLDPECEPMSFSVQRAMATFGASLGRALNKVSRGKR